MNEWLSFFETWTLKERHLTPTVANQFRFLKHPSYHRDTGAAHPSSWERNSWVNGELRDYGINREIDVLNEFSGLLTI